jgi:predicted PurR-regulated permease PerM
MAEKNIRRQSGAIDPLYFYLSSWVFAAVVLIIVLKLHLLPALFAGLAVYELVHLISPKFHGYTSTKNRARLWVLALIATFIVAILWIFALWSVSLFRFGAGSLPRMAQMMAEIIEGSRDILPAGLLQYLPGNVDAMNAAVAKLLRNHAETLQADGGIFVRSLAYILIGMVVGALLSLREVTTGRKRLRRPLATAIAERARRFTRSFRRVVFAQVRIAALNTFLTWLYLGVALPLLGISIPYVKTMVALTFIVGLLPVIGNIISNTVIVVISLSVSFQVAGSSLLFLVIIHKLEYFINARIIGARIDAHAWELLLAMLVMEAAFGLSGLVAAPVYYAYLKDELEAQHLV